MDENYLLNVQAYGARGDGYTDDTLAIQRAMEASASTGAAVWLPMGVYRVGTLHVPSGVTLMGNASWGYSAFGLGNNQEADGRDVVDPAINGHTVLMPLRPEGRALMDLGGSRSVRIIGLSLDGDFMGVGMHGIYAGEGSAELSLEDVRVCHFTGSAIRLQGTRGFSLRRSLLIKNRRHALDIGGSADGSVVDNQLAYNWGAGLYAKGEAGDGTWLGARNVTVIGNRIEGGYPGGVYAVNSSVLTLSGNSFDGCRAAGITLLGCDHCSATANMTRIHGQRAEGDENCHIRMEYCRDCVLTGNTSWCWYQLLKQREDVKTGPLYGLVLRGLTRCVVSGNALHECCHIDPVRDYGGHTDTLIEHNMGQAFDLATLA